MPEPEPTPETESIIADAADIALVAKTAQDVAEQAWISVILPILTSYRTAPEIGTLPASPNVDAAIDSLIVTACARLKRILRSDLGK